VPLLFEECEPPALIKSLNYIDVSSTEKLEQNYPRIWQLVGGSEPNDIDQRSREIDDLFDQGESEQGVKRLLDFGEEFADRQDANRLTAISWELKRLNKESDAINRAMVRVELITSMLNIRDGIINTLSLVVA
jgi:hypothetical protein